jgi:hypothetical protein
MRRTVSDVDDAPGVVEQPVTVESQVPEQPSPFIGVDTHFDLTPEIKKKIKDKYPYDRLKKVTLFGQDYVFRVITHEKWQKEVITWRKDNVGVKNLDDVDFDKKILEVALVFPAIPYEFGSIGHQLVFWNNQPAGAMSRLARQIEYHSGFFVQELSAEDDVVVEDLFDFDRPERPDESTITRLKESCSLPLRLIGVMDEWYVIRAMKHSEARLTMKAIRDNPEGEHDVKQLKRCILHGTTDFEDMPAGVVNTLIYQLRMLSGLGEDNVFGDVVEDL